MQLGFVEKEVGLSRKGIRVCGGKGVGVVGRESGVKGMS